MFNACPEKRGLPGVKTHFKVNFRGRIKPWNLFTHGALCIWPSASTEHRKKSWAFSFQSKLLPPPSRRNPTNLIKSPETLAGSLGRQPINKMKQSQNKIKNQFFGWECPRNKPVCFKSASLCSEKWLVDTGQRDTCTHIEKDLMQEANPDLSGPLPDAQEELGRSVLRMDSYAAFQALILFLKDTLWIVPTPSHFSEVPHFSNFHSRFRSSMNQEKSRQAKRRAHWKAF